MKSAKKGKSNIGGNTEMLTKEMREKIKKRAWELRKKEKERQYIRDCENGINQGTDDDPNDYDDTRYLHGWD